MLPQSFIFLLLLLLLLLGQGAHALCTTSGTYSYGSGACASCAAGAAFVSAAAGCTPSAMLTAGPTDTAFYLSGSSAEGVAALTLTGAALTFVADHTGAAGGALALAGSGYLTATGASAPAALPSGGSVAFSASAWVKCAAPATWAAVLEWGAAGDAQQLTSSQALSLVVGAPVLNSGVVTTLQCGLAGPTGVASLLSNSAIAIVDGSHSVRLVTPVGVVTTLAGTGFSNFADGTGASAAFFWPQGLAVIPSSGVIVVADAGNQRIRLVTPLGVTTTLAGHCNSPGLYGNCNGDFSDGIGAAASFAWITSVAILPLTETIVVADAGNGRIRLVTNPGGAVTTIAGGNGEFNNPTGIAVIP